jgi:hypothetical protein
MTRWGWEFLRRRDDYRRAWQERVRPFVNGDHYDLAAVNRHNLDVLRACKEGRPLYLPPPWDALRDDFKVYGDPATRTPHNSKLDPRLAQPPWFQGLGVTTVVFSTRGHTPDSKVLIEYDLNLPIKPQLKNAAVALLLKAEACGVADPDGGMQVDKFPRYLRLLDFKAARMLDKVIGKYLFSNASGEKLRDSIRKGLVSASQWQENYWHIALHDDVSSR